MLFLSNEPRVILSSLIVSQKLITPMASNFCMIVFKEKGGFIVHCVHLFWDIIFKGGHFSKVGDTLLPWSGHCVLSLNKAPLTLTVLLST